MPEAPDATPPTPDNRPAPAEPNLVPVWYPRVLRRRRWLRLQMVGSFLLLVGMVLFLIMRRDNEQVTAWQLRNIDAGRIETQSQIELLRSEEQRLELLLKRASINEKIGLPVEATRLLAELEATMPDELCLDRIELRTESELIPGTARTRPTRLVLDVKAKVANLDEAEVFFNKLKANPILFNVKPVGLSNGYGTSGQMEFGYSIVVDIALIDHGDLK